MMLKAASWLGWTPAQMWAATLWEFETATLAKIESTRQPEAPDATQEEVMAAFRALPGFTRVDRHGNPV